MTEYIDKQAVLDNIAEIRAKHGLKEDEEMEFAETDIVGLLLCTPEADVAPVRHGKLVGIKLDEDLCNNGFCSECGGKNTAIAGYCNWCGARMDGRC